jgi:hypothetical protein
LFRRILGRYVESMKKMKGYTHKKYQMEKIMPSFEYEPLVLSLEPKTSNEEEDRGNVNGVGPLGTKTIEDELGDLRGGRITLRTRLLVR